MDIKNIIYKKFGFENRKLQILEKKVLEYYQSDSNRKECEEEYSFLVSNPLKTRNNKLYAFHAPFINLYNIENIEVFYDRTYKMYYVIHNGVKMYMKKSFTKKQAKEYYLSLLAEQDKNSPHRYLDDELMNKHYRTIVDVGAAEGIFAIEMLDFADHIILFEYDSEWIEALRKTFFEYTNLVEIRKAFVTDEIGTNKTTLDIQMDDSRDIDLLKMDVEGAESNVISGAREIFINNPQLICLACVYHNNDDEKKLRELLPDYSFEPRKGKMIFPERYRFKRNGSKIMTPKKQMTGPFFTNGVVKIKHED